MLVAGTQMLGRKYHLFGQGMIGAGIATLYLSVYAAHSMFAEPLIDDTTAFALMIAVTCIAGWIAVRFNSLLVAVLGILGGFGTPIMLQTGVVNYVGLYSYLLILSAGVFGVSYKKNWHLLNYLSFIGTYGLFFATLAEWHYRPADFWQVMPFLIAFFVLYSTMTFLFNLVHRKKSSLLEVLGPVDQRRRVLRHELRHGERRLSRASGWRWSASGWPPSTRRTSTTSSFAGCSTANCCCRSPRCRRSSWP